MNCNEEICEINTIFVKLHKMDVATEHASTNTAISLIKIINERITARTRSQESSSKYKAVICTPDGELHGLSCNMIESPLLSKDSNLLPFCKERS